MWRAGLLLYCAVAAGTAAGSEPLKTARCERALDALHQAESAIRAARAGRQGQGGAAEPARVAEVLTLRRQAAVACLLQSNAPASAPLVPLVPPARDRAPVEVTPHASPARPAAQAAPLPAAPRPGPVPVPVPAAVTLCDANGCWTNNGTRLQRLGPGLVGPTGICTVQGTLLHCP